MDNLASVLSENGETGKNMISMKSIIKIICSLSLVFLTLLGLLTVGGHVEIAVIIFVTIFTLYLIKYVQSPKVKVFFYHKLSQTKTKTNEKLIAFKSSISIFKKNKVGVQNMVQET